MSEKKRCVKKPVKPADPAPSVVADPKITATNILINALRDVHVICSAERRRVGDIVPSGTLSDTLDEVIRPAAASLNRFLADWNGGRP